jgi:hypothetical protein
VISQPTAQVASSVNSAHAGTASPWKIDRLPWPPCPGRTRPPRPLPHGATGRDPDSGAADVAAAVPRGDLLRPGQGTVRRARLPVDMGQADRCPERAGLACTTEKSLLDLRRLGAAPVKMLAHGRLRRLQLVQGPDRPQVCEWLGKIPAALSGGGVAPTIRGICAVPRPGTPSHLPRRWGVGSAPPR